MLESTINSFQDVLQYPEKHMQMISDKVYLSVTYQRSWDDGFGARGWKVDATIGDPQIIASTRETGPRINTSVFIHDILDHYLSGFGVSGHRSEAMALVQLSKRTNSSPKPDYEQIISEDILNGRVNGESMKTFLPQDLVKLLPIKSNMTDKEVISFLNKKMGELKLKNNLVKHFFKLGKAGEEHAIQSWKKLGLNPDKQAKIGLALQKLLVKIDSKVEKMQIEKLKGFIVIDNHDVSFNINSDDSINPIGHYQIAVN